MLIEFTTEYEALSTEAATAAEGLVLKFCLHYINNVPVWRSEVTRSDSCVRLRVKTPGLIFLYYVDDYCKHGEQ